MVLDKRKYQEKEFQFMKMMVKFTSDGPLMEMQCRFSKGVSKNRGRYLFTGGRIPWKTKALKE